MNAKEWIKEIQKEDRERKKYDINAQTFSSKDVIYTLRDIIKTEKKKA